MRSFSDGPCSNTFTPVRLTGNISWADLATVPGFAEFPELIERVPAGDCVFRGLAVRVGKRPVLLTEGCKPVTRKLPGVRAQWLLFVHTSGIRPCAADANGIISPMHGKGQLSEHAADYVLRYADGTEARTAIRRRFQIGAQTARWGENCAEAFSYGKPYTMRSTSEQFVPGADWNWGRSQTRACDEDRPPFNLWLWAWENPHPRRELVTIRFEPGAGSVVIAALSAGNVQSCPLRWRSRRKAVLRLPRGSEFDPTLGERGQLHCIRLDLGQVISAAARPLYPNAEWARTYNNAVPTLAEREILVEYTSHDRACFHLPGRAPIPVQRLETRGRAGPLRVVPPAAKTVRIRVVDAASGSPVAVKFHAHGEAGEYLPPNVLHRVPNSLWFEDYSPEFQHQARHFCVYIDGETQIRTPLGKIYIEVSKGFEIRPLRKVVNIRPGTRTITIKLDKVLHWRESGWVCADTHVHFLSPQTGLVEGAGEGVNVVNLLASQWGELMTNVGDFDGSTVFGAKTAGGDGEYLVRVGTENRQHVLGHISLVGYNGPIIAPMTTGGPNESALGDPVEVLLTQWARQCRAQGGVVVIPHFPNPRLEHAATIVSGDADAIEMCSWGDLYSGIDPYSLSDWYRYLNNGYQVAAVGGTDKMEATTAVGTVRSYARLAPGEEFDYDAWKAAIRRGETFVTYGPLLEFSVDGHNMGTRFRMRRSGGTVDVTWRVASVTVPVTRVQLIANGVVVADRTVDPAEASGHFTVTVDRCTWLALLVRGRYADKPEIIAAHSSAVMIDVADTEFYQAADSLSILDQIEGALAYLDTVGTRAEDAVYKRMRLVLTAIHRQVHNRMHRLGRYHEHTVTENHPEHE